ncbi:DUF6702 family protein [Bizionia sediminis]|uniref:DUF6702 family protein n=1 Tax=Bizionia sediminis TaxID=1737064 RepID=A0ABW5KTI9_9FLAO
MTWLKYSLVVLVFPLLAFTGVHKYYVSITQVEYVPAEKSVQIISRYFIDDFERALRERYDATVTLMENEDTETVNKLMQRYLTAKILVVINGTEVPINFLGKEYENDIVYCYLEIDNVAAINTFEMRNTVLFDVFSDQKNIIRTNINNEYNSFILNIKNDKGMLNFK